MKINLTKLLEIPTRVTIFRDSYVVGKLSFNETTGDSGKFRTSDFTSPYRPYSFELNSENE